MIDEDEYDVHPLCEDCVIDLLRGEKNSQLDSQLNKDSTITMKERPAKSDS
jgi:hypothetical protein